MPAAKTELYGTTDHRFLYSYLSIFTQIFFCVTVVSASTSGTAVLALETSPDGTTWTEMGAGSMRDTVASVGLQCTNVNITVPGGALYTRVVGINGAAAGDLPAFGAITLAWIGTSASQTLSLPVAFYPPVIVALTPTSFSLKIQFLASISLANTVTFNWQSIGS
jgi:hypothetical protein